MRFIAIILTAGLTTLVFGQAVSADTYYTTGQKFPNSGSAWNQAKDNTGSAGVSNTYNSGANDLIFQSGDEIYTANGSTAFKFKAKSFTFDGISLVNNSTSKTIATFDGGDITVTSKGATILQGAAAGSGKVGGGVGGGVDVQLGSNTIGFAHLSSKSSGIYNFGLNVVGNGTLDLGFANSLTSWEFSNLSTDFTGTILGDTFNGSLILAPGNGASAASVVIGRLDADRTGKLDLIGDFSVKSLTIDGDRIAKGIYTYKDLIALDAGYADNLVDHKGRVFVGVRVEKE